MMTKAGTVLSITMENCALQKENVDLGGKTKSGAPCNSTHMANIMRKPLVVHAAVATEKNIGQFFHLILNDLTSLFRKISIEKTSIAQKDISVLPFNLKRLDKFVQKDFHRKNINRAKRHISSLKTYIEDHPSKDWDPVVVQAIDTCLETVGEGKPNQETTWQALQECWAEFSNILIESDGDSYPFLKE